MTSNKRKIELKPNVMRDESVIYVMKWTQSIQSKFIVSDFVCALG